MSVSLKAVEIGGVQLNFCFVKAGEFSMGSNDSEVRTAARSFWGVRKKWLKKEMPRHQVRLDDYWISTTVVSQELFAKFESSTNRRDLEASEVIEQRLPAIVNDFDLAVDFCTWASEVTGLSLRLPTEEEWEKGARGEDGRQFPWGEHFSREKCNTLESRNENLVAVDAYSEFASPYGMIQAGGNVEEWTSSVYKPYNGGPLLVDNFSANTPDRILRGGKFNSRGDLARCARRHGYSSETVAGIRLVANDLATL